MVPLPLFVVMTYSGSRTSWYREFPAMPACSYVRFGNICRVPASQATPSEAWNLHVRKICSLLLSGEKSLVQKGSSLGRSLSILAQLLRGMRLVQFGRGVSLDRSYVCMKRRLMETGAV
jgi:hypothetical protein